MKTTETKNSRTVMIIIIATLCILAIAGVIIYSLGFRYIKTDYAKFIGWTRDGAPISGSIKYADGVKGKMHIDKESGNLVIDYSSGDKYEGDLLGIVRDGKGIITYSNDDVYKGDFKNDMRTGEATINYADGSEYIGTVENGLPHGKGIYTFADSSWYYGDFDMGIKHGVGEYHDADGSYYYGSFKNDLKDGTEVITVPLFDKSEYMGRCKLVYASGSVYVGDFVKDKRTGSGTYTWSSGERYEGEFKNGIFEGTGSYYFAEDTTPSYTGLFKDGKIANQDTSVVPAAKED